MNSRSWWGSLVILAGLLALASCGGSKETVTVTERAEETTSSADIETAGAADTGPLFPSEVDAAAVQELILEGAKPAVRRRLSAAGREAMALLRRYASQGVAPEELDAVTTALVRLQCELYIAAELPPAEREDVCSVER
jgi:hypothetical protein